MSQKIAFLKLRPDDPTATGERGRAIVSFLRSIGHVVEVLHPSVEGLRDFDRFRFSLWSRLKRRALGRAHLPHLWDFIADDLEPQIRRGSYDLVIGLGPDASYVLTRNLSARKILDTPNVAFLERYHAIGADLNEVELSYRKEIEIYKAADHILIHHEILTRFVRRHVYDSDKVATVRMGCTPRVRPAQFSTSPRIVYAGSYGYIQDPFLLALLSGQSPWPIHCYGSRDPNRSFLPARLDFRGYAPTLDVLADYQFGLVTVSADRLRRASPSTKFAYYFAAGLPVFFPEWMEEGHTYEAAIPYTENGFARTVQDAAGDERKWRELSEKATAIAGELSWEKVLRPLGDIVSGSTK
jgi:hypothetical protein